MKSQSSGKAATREKIALLLRSPIFCGLGAAGLEELASIAFERSFEPGEFIVLEGDKSEWFYLVKTGRVKVVKQTPSGKEFILSVFFPGDLFGTVAAFQGVPYPASAQAIDRTTVIGMETSRLRELLARNPDMVLKMLNDLGERLEKAHSRLRDLAVERVDQRVARTLLMLAGKIGPSLPFTKQEIADMTGTTTETAIRVMSRLSTGGVIRSSRGKIVIVDEQRLRLLAEGPPSV